MLFAYYGIRKLEYECGMTDINHLSWFRWLPIRPLSAIDRSHLLDDVILLGPEHLTAEVASLHPASELFDLVYNFLLVVNTCVDTSFCSLPHLGPEFGDLLGVVDKFELRQSSAFQSQILVLGPEVIGPEYQLPFCS